MHDAGYHTEDIDSLLAEFDQVIGLDKLHCIHVNDSKNPFASHKDRHENIGFGDLGFEQILSYCYHPKLENIPKILETPYIDHTYPPYRYEIAMIRSKKFDPELKEKIIAN